MAPGRLHDALLSIHRWIGLLLTPLFVLIIVSGALLALRPMLETRAAGAASAETIRVGTVADLLASIGDAGKATQLQADAAAHRLTIRGGGPARAYSLEDGRSLPPPSEQSNPFNTIERFHRDLLIGAGALVEIAAYLMLGLVVVGPLLSWPRLRNTILGWHLGAGWLALPLVLMLPLTAVLMTLHVGAPSLPRPDPSAETSLPAALNQTLNQTLSRDAMVQQLGVRRFHGSVLVSVNDGTDGDQMWVVAGDTVTPLDVSGNWPRQLHEGTWAGPWSGAINLIGAVALLVLTITGAWSWLQRRRGATRRDGAADAEWLVAYASQTGTAARLAEATAAALRSTGRRVLLVSLGALEPAELQRFGKALLIASTTGEGAPPDTCRALLRKLESARVDGLRFSLLALGDSRYAQFCGGGRTLFDTLKQAGAAAVTPMRTADGDPTPAWSDWIKEIDTMYKLGLQADSMAALQQTGDVDVRLRLCERHVLTRLTDADTQESNALVFECDAKLDFRPGDLLLIRPSANEAPRCYSLGSSSRVNPHRLQLTVSRAHWVDAQGLTHYGRTSDLLCTHLQVGEQIDAQLRRHPQFNPPDAATQPLVMIAAGCGIAPFIGFLEERAAAPEHGPAWLLFGNRKHDGDYLYRSRLQALQASGVLERLDTAFSRDTPSTGYVTDRVREQGVLLLRWLDRPECVLYVCGRASTLGHSIDTALTDVLVQQRGQTPAQAREQLDQWAASGKYRRDLFD
jgi:sulfite reductase (NADPH) flavoprotein alpha-component